MWMQDGGMVKQPTTGWKLHASVEAGKPMGGMTTLPICFVSVPF